MYFRPSNYLSLARYCKHKYLLWQLTCFEVFEFIKYMLMIVQEEIQKSRSILFYENVCKCGRCYFDHGSLGSNLIRVFPSILTPLVSGARDEPI